MGQLEKKKRIPDNVTKAALLLVAFLFGGSASIGGINLQPDFGDWISNNIFGESTAEYKPYNNIESFHAITTVLAVTRKDGRLIGATLSDAGTRAELFYGKTGGAAELHLKSRTPEQLEELLRPYMNEENFKEMKTDQTRLFNAYQDGRPAHAEVPVIFNDKHPNYGNRAFLPVIVSVGQLKKKEDHAERLIQIAYFDLRHFFKPVDHFRRHLETVADQN